MKISTVGFKIFSIYLECVPYVQIMNKLPFEYLCTFKHKIKNIIQYDIYITLIKILDLNGMLFFE